MDGTIEVQLYGHRLWMSTKNHSLTLTFYSKLHRYGVRRTIKPGRERNRSIHVERTEKETKMNSRERVMTALRCQEPDRVPYCELGIDRSLAQQLMGWGASANRVASMESNLYTLEEATALADELLLDNLVYVLRAPVYAERAAGEDGRLFYAEGQIRGWDDLARLELPDPHDDNLYTEAIQFAAGKGERSVWFVTRIGLFPAMLSMGIEHFSLALYDDRALVETILERYYEWVLVVTERVNGMGFDAFVSTDDFAFNTGPFLSPALFRELAMPYYRKVGERLTLPWIIHSDGNVMPYLPDLMELGIAGLHPIEKGAMDMAAVKRTYGSNLCLLGNVDLNILGLGTPQDVDREVQELIQVAGPGGGYVVTSGNSLASYVKPENARSLSAAVQKYGRYPLAPN